MTSKQIMVTFSLVFLAVVVQCAPATTFRPPGGKTAGRSADMYGSMYPMGPYSQGSSMYGGYPSMGGYQGYPSGYPYSSYPGGSSYYYPNYYSQYGSGYPYQNSYYPGMSGMGGMNGMSGMGSMYGMYPYGRSAEGKKDAHAKSPN